MISFVSASSIAVVAVVAAVSAAVAQPYPGSDHDTLEECYDYQFNQYVAGDGNFDNYDWGMSECEETYGAAAALPPGFSSVKALRAAKTQKALQIRPPKTQR
jgi:hypothetical protein